MGSEIEHPTGKLVALEGDAELIATQLRLLPPSQKILVLPPLQDDFSFSGKNESNISAGAIIQDVHNALVKRKERARSFLQSSTSFHPKIVFMNGGTISARTICIARISESITNSQIGQAEAIFNETIRRDPADILQGGGRRGKIIVAEATEEHQLEKEEFGHEDSGSESIDSTDSLNGDEILLQRGRFDNAKVLENNWSLRGEPVINVLNESDLLVPQLGETKVTPDENLKPKDDIFMSQGGDTIVKTVLTIPNVQKGKKTYLAEATTFGSRHPNRQMNQFTAASEAKTVLELGREEDNPDDTEPESPGDSFVNSNPPTPRVIYGEACIVDIQSARIYSARTESFFRRAQSVDELCTSPTSEKLKHSKSELHLKARSHIPRATSDTDFERFLIPKRTSLRKVSPKTVRRFSMPSGSMGYLRTLSHSCTYTDRGTDGEEITFDEPVEELSRPWFELEEDLVIHFTGTSFNEILESVIRSYKNGSSASISSSTKTCASPSLDSSLGQVRIGSDRRDTSFTVETDDLGYEGDHEFDPYADCNYPTGIKRQRSQKKYSGADSGISNVGLPTPTMTPPPTSTIAEKIISFPTTSGNVVDVQNLLRQLLNLHFPGGEYGYTQYCFPVSPDVDRLWKPVFQADSTIMTGNEDKTVDQIIALGYEEGVKSDFFLQISGQIERLGAKRDGLNRSGKLDIRYLIANAMQTMSSHYYGSQFDPLSQPTVLAALLIPQLESYLVSNMGTRVLVLHYASTHLPTVFALRNLLGSELFRIAGILDAQEPDPSPIVCPRKPLTINHHPNNAMISSTQSRFNEPHANHSSTLQNPSARDGLVEPSVRINEKKGDTVMFAKADYLLPSTATIPEIISFLADISKQLMEKSSFYSPEPEPKHIIEKLSLPPTPTSTAPTITSRELPKREREQPPISSRGTLSKMARLTGSTNTNTAAQQSSKTRHGYSSSIISTKTTASEVGRRRDKEWENFYIGEDDSEDDAYDKMILGRTLARIVPEVRRPETEKKANTRKALKWLGLA